ncbi:ABC transporter ATP-binding protein [Streptomyces sp. AgN23]|uniref:ABC transporter ATP-binding protein n=1 Tax=Streptomyces sp. AgN23 TaxID=1188315 RepID=UPI001B32FF9C|nr:ABC transporter ATP-binding protein [Streptomyces sp. AgN23]QTI87263.1 ABC transporter ATP-binding protein [Streptomyces sp. AgN23]
MTDEAATPLLQAREVSVRFGGVNALAGVTVAVDAGEVVGLIGPNGAGKTTLVNVLSGFQRPTSGSVRFDGRDVTRWAGHQRARAGLVRTFQAVRLFPAMTVTENLQAAGIAGGRPVAAAEAHARELVRSFGLSAYSDAPAAGLPHGVERRVGILRVLATRPRVILLDEPAAGLNERESDMLGQSLHDIRAEYGVGICVIEHDMRLIMSRCDRVHVLASGSTLAAGTPQEIRAHEAVIDAYLGAG